MPIGFQLLKSVSIVDLLEWLLCGCDNETRKGPQQEFQKSSVAIAGPADATSSNLPPVGGIPNQFSSSGLDLHSASGISQAEADALSAVLQKRPQPEQLADIYAALFLQTVDPLTPKRLAQSFPGRLPRIDANVAGLNKTNFLDGQTGGKCMLVQTRLEASNAVQVVFVVIVVTGSRGARDYMVHMSRVGDVWKVTNVDRGAVY